MAAGAQKRSREGPFRPGPGRLPPYLAGRESEQSLLRNRLADLADGLAPASEIILCGPRGNGKTVLLCWLEDEAVPLTGVNVIRLTPSAIPVASDLVARLTPWWKRVVPSGLAWGVSPNFHGGTTALLDRVLESRARRKPLMLLLDEAHTLDREVGRALLNASQLVGARYPFLLVLAGTPDLETRLRSLSASFWGRATQLRVNRLDDEAAAAAIRRPLEADGIVIGDASLARIVRESQGYPYFLQLWGAAVWQRVAPRRGADRRVGRDDLEAAQAAFDETRRLYYRQRYDELKDRGLLPVAREVAAAFAEHPRLTDAGLGKAVRGGIAAAGTTTPGAAQQTLRHLGYVWQSGAGLDWEPGIPSLMDFVREHAPAA